MTVPIVIDLFSHTSHMVTAPLVRILSDNPPRFSQRHQAATVVCQERIRCTSG
jgi:hypothetical protein